MVWRPRSGQVKVFLAFLAIAAAGACGSDSKTAPDESPTARIDAPANGAIYHAGDVIQFSGGGEEPLLHVLQQLSDEHSFG